MVGAWVLRGRGAGTHHLCCWLMGPGVYNHGRCVHFRGETPYGGKNLECSGFIEHIFIVSWCARNCFKPVVEGRTQ